MGRYLRDQLSGGVSRPCLGLLDGEPISYWELYRAAHDPLARAYEARPHDIGIHLLIGDAARTGRGLGTAQLSAVRRALFAADRRCSRLVAEPDVANLASIRAFARAGFARVGDVALGGKTAALMVAERADAVEASG